MRIIPSPNDSGCALVAAKATAIVLKVIKEDVFNALPHNLYVFSAQGTRMSSVYISPSIPRATALAQFLQFKSRISLDVAAIGKPSYKEWIALRKDVRESTLLAAKVVALTALFINNKLNL